MSKWKDENGGDVKDIILDVRSINAVNIVEGVNKTDDWVYKDAQIWLIVIMKRKRKCKVFL